MMSKDMDQFEQRLRRQPVKPVPADWRAEILAAARAARPVERPAASRNSWFVSLLHEILFSVRANSKGWAGLAAVWVLIVALNLSMQTSAPASALAEKTVPATPERIAELKQQQRMFAELDGLTTPPDADRPKAPPLPPHSQRAGWMTI
jgi:hypothetical protein